MSDFRIENHPLVLMKPRIVSPYAWVGHIPFAYLVVDLLRPRVLVELGTHSGNSYMAFCQAVRALNFPSRCTAVDAWQGDEHALHYGEEIYQSLRARHDPVYGDFSRLLRSFFDEAVGQFEDGSIDLLHIDGLHTYEAVRHDFETWLPKLSESAVVLLHDTQVRERGFGVYQFFDELKERYSCFSFLHSHGLGVVAVGANVPHPFVDFMRDAGDSPATVRGFFEALANTLVGVDDRPVPAAVTAPLPVVCHLFYRRHDESFDESRMISQPVDAGDGVLDIQFRLPAGTMPDYLRLDPADLPGVFGFSRVLLRLEGDATALHLDHLADRLGHVGGELLSTVGSQAIRLVSFDGDPYVEFEVASVLAAVPESRLLEVTIRVEYEVVVQDPLLHQLLEKQAASLNDMRQLSHQRMHVQNLARDYSRQSVELRNLMSEFSSQRMELRQLASDFSEQSMNLRKLASESSVQSGQIQKFAGDFSEQSVKTQNLARESALQYKEIKKLTDETSSQRSEIRGLTVEIDRMHEQVWTGLQRLEQGIDLLTRRGLWSRVRRIIKRGR